MSSSCFIQDYNSNQFLLKMWADFAKSHFSKPRYLFQIMRVPNKKKTNYLRPRHIHAVIAITNASLAMNELVTNRACVVRVE